METNGYTGVSCWIYYRNITMHGPMNVKRSYDIWFISHGWRTKILCIRQEHEFRVYGDKVPSKTSVPNYLTRKATIIFSTTTLLHVPHIY